MKGGFDLSGYYCVECKKSHKNINECKYKGRKRVDCSTITIFTKKRHINTIKRQHNLDESKEVIMAYYRQINGRIYLCRQSATSLDGLVQCINHETLHKVLHKTINGRTSTLFDKISLSREC